MRAVLRALTLGSALAVLATGTIVLAQATPEELAAAVESRHTHMKAYGAALGVLGSMAKEEVAFDPVAAVAAADKLVELTSIDQSAWWVAGTAAGEIADSRARPELFANYADYEARTQAMNAAAVAMQTAAATDLASLQAALGAIGGSCGSCHEVYRAPEN